MSILQLPHKPPQVILFDWHATLVDTHDAMYHAVDDVLPKLDELGLRNRLLDPQDSKTIEDAKLLMYVRENKQLHPKVKAQRKISRTDIFEVLFGGDADAKRIAHQAFDNSYRKFVGQVYPLEDGIREQLGHLHTLGLTTGLISNRNREFMQHELAIVDGSGWADLFATMACGNDVKHRKPHPDLLIKALDNLGKKPDQHTWYIGDSTTDVIAAKIAGVTAVFYNGAGWNDDWINKIFPGTVRHPYQPDAVVDSMPDLVALARHLLAQEIRVDRARG